MDLQYISDEQGRQTAVIVPIDEWKSIVANQHQPNNEQKPRKKPSDFVGILTKEEARKMIADIEKSREEWERNI